MNDPSSPYPARRRAGVVSWIVVIILAFAAGVALTALLRPTYDRWFGVKAANTLASDRPATPVTPPVGPVPDLNALAAREAALAGQVAALEARTATVAVDALGASTQAARAENLLVAFAARRAIDRGRPLGYLEDQLRIRFAAQPGAIDTIAAAARAPVTLEDLRQALDATTADLTTGGLRGGWVASLAREISTLVVIRKAGTPSPGATDRLARARRLLDAGQVEAALAEVERLPGAATATNWTQAARRYALARRALDAIENTALTAPSPVVAGMTPGPIPGL